LVLEISLDVGAWNLELKTCIAFIFRSKIGTLMRLSCDNQRPITPRCLADEARDKAILFNGEGREITAEVIELHRDEIRLRKLHETETPPFRCRITAWASDSQRKSMDLIVQKAVELGAAEIAPIISERTIVTLHAKEAAQKRAKWRQAAIEAAKQCGQNWLPHVLTRARSKNCFQM